jgi:tRNA-specific 2-thiouridylase
MDVIGNAALGADLAWVRLTLRAGRVQDATGEGDGIQELCRAVRGLPVLEAAAVPAPRLAAEALHDALGPAAVATVGERRVAVAMSGGVDSAVALLRARDEGFEPVGVTLRLWTDPGGPDSERVCCSPSAVAAARDACHGLGFPHFTLDLREQFRRSVVAPFVRSYARGETPNPCVRCNGGFRFAELLAFARRVGAAKLATGHYARIVERDGTLLLARATDHAKDQSYMLARLDPRWLPRLWFPLGEQGKEQTREEARRAGLAAAERRESQEACFLAGGDYRDFLTRHGLEPADGPVVDEHGRELGRHDGFWRFTPGQRRGLGVSTGAPVYALRTEPRTNTVFVGAKESRGGGGGGARAGRLFAPADRVEAKVRYRSPATAASVTRMNRGFRLDLEMPAYGVAAGQAAVLYDGEAVVGAGLISSAS